MLVLVEDAAHNKWLYIHEIKTKFRYSEVSSIEN